MTSHELHFWVTPITGCDFSFPLPVQYRSFVNLHQLAYNTVPLRLMPIPRVLRTENRKWSPSLTDHAALENTQNTSSIGSRRTAEATQFVSIFRWSSPLGNNTDCACQRPLWNRLKAKKEQSISRVFFLGYSLFSVGNWNASLACVR